jgi:hypothetical protein
MRSQKLPLVRAMLAFLAASSMSLFAAYAQSPQICSRCEPKLELNRGQWTCLKQKLPTLQNTQTPIVVFDLSPSGCGVDLGAEKSAAVVFPQPRSSTGQTASRIYILSREQLQCVTKLEPVILPTKRIVIDFATQCEATAQQ